MTKRKRYKRYSPEFKREALKRASEEGVRQMSSSVKSSTSVPGNCVDGEMNSGC